MHHMRILLPVAAALLLGACVTPPQPTWNKSGVTADDAHSVLAQCQYDIGLSKVDAEKEKQLIGHCMEAKGFRWRVY